jgi:hypothetical protein
VRTPQQTALNEMSRSFFLAALGLIAAVATGAPALAQTSGTGITEDFIVRCNVPNGFAGNGVGGLAVSNAGKIVYAGQCLSPNDPTLTGSVLGLYEGSGADSAVSFDDSNNNTYYGFLGLLAGPDETFWFMDGGGVVGSGQQQNYHIGHMTGAGHGGRFLLPTQITPTGGFTIGPDGAVWFVSNDATTCAGQISRMAADGTVTTFPVPASSATVCLQTSLLNGPDGNLWFYVNLSYPSLFNLLYKMTTAGQFTGVQIPKTFATSVGVGSGLIVGPDSNIWVIGYTYTYAPVLLQVTTTGSINAYPFPSSVVTVDSITAGTDGAIWFGDNNPELGRMTTAGVVSSVPLPAPYANSTCTPAGASLIQQGSQGKLNFIIRGSSEYPCILLGSYTLPSLSPETPKLARKHAENSHSLKPIAPSSGVGPAPNYVNCGNIGVKCQFSVFPRSIVQTNSETNTATVTYTNVSFIDPIEQETYTIGLGMGKNFGQCNFKINNQPAIAPYRVSTSTPTEPDVVVLEVTPTDYGHGNTYDNAVCSYPFQLVETFADGDDSVLDEQTLFVKFCHGCAGGSGNNNPLCTTEQQCFPF